ncbi:hypothetical protein [Trueperella pyogenes]
MIRSEQIQVEVRADVAVDDLGNRVEGFAPPIKVENVLVAPGPTRDLTGSIRPDGDKSQLTLHFPKTFDTTIDLRGARVIVRGEAYLVQGSPAAYTAANTPTAWSMPVTVEKVEG